MTGGNTQTEGQQSQTASWQFVGDDAADAGHDADAPSVTSSSPVVEWTASEFVAHDKGASWYVLLALGGIFFAALGYIVTRDRVTLFVTLFFVLVVGVAGARKPRVVRYRLVAKGIVVGSRLHRYNEFKSFVIRQEGPFVSIELMPMRRFALPQGLYLAPDSQQRVLEELSQHLPLEHGELTALERLMHRLRF